MRKDLIKNLRYIKGRSLGKQIPYCEGRKYEDHQLIICGGNHIVFFVDQFLYFGTVVVLINGQTCKVDIISLTWNKGTS